MISYPDLSMPGKIHRLRAMALLALGHYGLNHPEIALHAFDTNLLYRVTTASGERYMLRLALPGWRTFEDLQSEAVWVNSLHRDRVISKLRIIPAVSGEYVLPMSQPAIPNVWNTTLMSWVPGRLLGYYLTAPNLEKMGKLFAELHSYSASWRPPAGFTTRRFEHWLSRGEQNLIITGEQPHAKISPPTGVGTLPARWRDLLVRMHLHVEHAYAALHRSDLRVIHCDLWHNNIKLHQGVLHPFDFEDTVWGFRLHDIAMAMLDLSEVTDDMRYAQLLSAFRRGYESHLAWPDGPLEPFQIGRLLWKINWVARFDPHWLSSIVERHIPVFQHYETTGRLIRPRAS